jgi:dienelactone hydrolase
MIASLFHDWEHRLASVSKDRVVRPFEWGEDWMISNGHSGRDAQTRVMDWVTEAMSDTRAFFDTPVTQDYQFEAAPAAVRRQGEAGTLRFPSALITPHAVNNTVHARWFPADPLRGTRPTYVGRVPRSGRGEAGPDTSVGRVPRPSTGSGRPEWVDGRGGPGRAVLVMSQWNADREGHVGLARLLARFGISALRMSLPYHDLRMPPELTRADYIVSSNIARTVQVCRQAVLDARRAIAWLALQGYERIGILGTSLGSCLAMLTTAHEPRIKAQALNHISPWFADVVWRGLSTQHVRKGLEGHVELSQLRELWRPISPFPYLNQVRHAETLLVYAKYDLTFPVDLSRSLVAEFKRRGVSHEVAVLPCGHYSTGMAPFKFLDAYFLVRFLRHNL